MRTKLNEFLTASSSTSADVLCLSETWLNDTISNGLIVDSICNIFRVDRSVKTYDKSRGGGVLIAVKRNLVVDQIPTLYDDLEQVYVKIECCDTVLIAGCIYITPNAGT